MKNEQSYHETNQTSFSLKDQLQSCQFMIWRLCKTLGKELKRGAGEERLEIAEGYKAQLNNQHLKRVLDKWKLYADCKYNFQEIVLWQIVNVESLFSTKGKLSTEQDCRKCPRMRNKGHYKPLQLTSQHEWIF